MCLACYRIIGGKPAGPAPPLLPGRVSFASPPTPSWTCYPSKQLQLQWIPPPPVVSTKAQPAAQSTEQKKALKPSAPPALKTGASYVFPRRMTYVHLIRHTKVWKKDAGTGWSFKMLRVPSCLSVAEFIDAMTGGAANGMAVTEVVEMGDGEFLKGTTVAADGDKASGSFESFAWNDKRGDTLPPVWLVLHKA